MRTFYYFVFKLGKGREGKRLKWGCSYPCFIACLHATVSANSTYNNLPCDLVLYFLQRHGTQLFITGKPEMMLTRTCRRKPTLKNPLILEDKKKKTSGGQGRLFHKTKQTIQITFMYISLTRVGKRLLCFEEKCL